MHSFVILDVTKFLAKANEHANIVDQNSDFYFVQFLFQGFINFVPIGEISSECFDLNRRKCPSY